MNSVPMKKMADFITHVIADNNEDYPRCVIDAASQVVKIKGEFDAELKVLDPDEVFARIGNLMYQATLESDIMNIGPENLKPFAHKTLADIERRLIKAIARVRQRLFIQRMRLECHDQKQTISLSKKDFWDILNKVTSPEMDIVDQELSVLAQTFK